MKCLRRWDCRRGCEIAALIACGSRAADIAVLPLCTLWLSVHCAKSFTGANREGIASSVNPIAHAYSETSMTPSETPRPTITSKHVRLDLLHSLATITASAGMRQLRRGTDYRFSNVLRETVVIFSHWLDCHILER